MRRLLKRGALALDRMVALPMATGWGRLRALGPRPPGMVGSFPDRESALASLPRTTPNSYDDDAVAPVNFALMCQTRVWDYPVMFWLDRLSAPGLRVLDAGGHFGTKYIAFRDRLPLEQMDWTVYDLPATVRAARAAQTRGEVPGQIGFHDRLASVGPVDVFLASGLMQYVDRPLGALLDELPERPRHVILNKVATREGATVVTLEKIGPARIPYQIRARAPFEQDLRDLGYAIRDSWEIPSLSHIIATHPALGASTSRGYYLERETA